MRREPADVARAFLDAWNAKDADALAAIFTGDADFVNVTGLHWTRRADIARAHAYGFEHIFANSTLELTDMRLRELGSDHAIVVAHWKLTGQTGPDGKDAGQRTSVMTFVCARTAEGWMATAAQNTDRIPGAETFVRRGRHLEPASYQRRAGERP